MNSELQRIYLDNNATTRIAHHVVRRMEEVLRRRLANPASQHQEGRESRSILEGARGELAKAFGCRLNGMEADQVILTSGGTEANNLAIHGLLAHREGDLIVSAIEHPSVLAAAEREAEKGLRRVRYLPVTAKGEVCLETWRNWLAAHVEGQARHTQEGQMALVSVMLANNETGVIQPIDEMIREARAEGVLVHIDAVQGLGKIPLHFQQLAADAMTVSAHKLHGPTGVGALVIRSTLSLQPILFGGFQQLGMRPGTESVALAIGFAEAARVASENAFAWRGQMTSLRELLESLLSVGDRPPIIVGKDSTRLPHTVSLAYPGIDRQALQMALDRQGIACSTGSACASGSGQPSHVLRAMNLPDAVVHSAIRLSLSSESTREEIIEAAARISAVVRRFPKAF